MASQPVRIGRSWSTALLIVAALPRLGFSQSAPCSYDRCAISTEARLFSTRLVAGREGHTIARLGMFPPRIQVLEQAPDSARGNYLAFRSSQRSGAWLSVAGLAAILGGAILASDHPSHDGLSVGFLAGGFALSLGAGISFRHAFNHLQHAVWWYNRDLPGSH